MPIKVNWPSSLVIGDNVITGQVSANAKVILRMLYEGSVPHVPAENVKSVANNKGEFSLTLNVKNVMDRLPKMLYCSLTIRDDDSKDVESWEYKYPRS